MLTQNPEYFPATCDSGIFAPVCSGKPTLLCVAMQRQNHRQAGLSNGSAMPGQRTLVPYFDAEGQVNEDIASKSTGAFLHATTLSQQQPQAFLLHGQSLDRPAQHPSPYGGGSNWSQKPSASPAAADLSSKLLPPSFFELDDMEESMSLMMAPPAAPASTGARPPTGVVHAHPQQQQHAVHSMEVANIYSAGDRKRLGFDSAPAGNSGGSSASSSSATSPNPHSHVYSSVATNGRLSTDDLLQLTANPRDFAPGASSVADPSVLPPSHQTAGTGAGATRLRKQKSPHTPRVEAPATPSAPSGPVGLSFAQIAAGAGVAVPIAAGPVQNPDTKFAGPTYQISSPDPANIPIPAMLRHPQEQQPSLTMPPSSQPLPQSQQKKKQQGGSAWRETLSSDRTAAAKPPSMETLSPVQGGKIAQALPAKGVTLSVSQLFDSLKSGSLRLSAAAELQPIAQAVHVPSAEEANHKIIEMLQKAHLPPEQPVVLRNTAAVAGSSGREADGNSGRKRKAESGRRPVPPPVAGGVGSPETPVRILKRPDSTNSSELPSAISTEDVTASQKATTSEKLQPGPHAERRKSPGPSGGAAKAATAADKARKQPMPTAADTSQEAALEAHIKALIGLK